MHRCARALVATHHASRSANPGIAGREIDIARRAAKEAQHPGGYDAGDREAHGSIRMRRCASLEPSSTAPAAATRKVHGPEVVGSSRSICRGVAIRLVLQFLGAPWREAAPPDCSRKILQVVQSVLSRYTNHNQTRDQRRLQRHRRNLAFLSAGSWRQRLSSHERAERQYGHHPGGSALLRKPRPGLRASAYSPAVDRDVLVRKPRYAPSSATDTAAR